MGYEIERLRKKLRGIDKELIKVLAKRRRLVITLGALKLKQGIPIKQPEVEVHNAAFRKNVAMQSKLDTAFVRRLFHLIVAESRKIQRKLRR